MANYRKDEKIKFDDESIETRAKKNLRRLYQLVYNKKRNLSPYYSDVLTEKRRGEKKQN
jgi:hypothetical protein